MFRIICVSACVYIFIACSSTKEHTNYKLANNVSIIKTPTFLRTDGVYINVFSAQGTTYYQFIRFFENGRCFISNHFTGSPGIDTLSLITKNIGQRTFYKNEGNDITFESWDGSYARYTYNYATVDILHLFLNSFRSRGFGSAIQRLPTPTVYEFKPISLNRNA